MIELNIDLPDGFLDEEVRCGYKVSKKMKEVWAIELDLLSELMRVCDKYNIKYFADGGTVLGAVRHSGFVPWDDDVDITLLREDYEKLCRVAGEEFSYPYFWQTEETDKGSIRCHAQLRNSRTTGMLEGEKNDKFMFNQGIFIDIFPFDSLPDDLKERKKFQRNITKIKSKMMKWANISIRYRKKDGFKGQLKSFLHFFVDHIYFFNKMYLRYYNEFINEIQRYNSKETKQVANIATIPDTEKFQFYFSDYKDSKMISFEFLQVPIPCGYDRYLTIHYGDWKKFVRGENSHGGCFFDTENPYTVYLK